jgi:anti-repressor protein
MANALTLTANEQFPVSGRDLHERLGIETQYTKWFERMVEYGFSEGKDYWTKMSNRSDGLPGKPRSDHQLTIDMAKHLCMIQRTPKGMEVRQYLIDLEQQWNTPEAVIARALKMATDKLSAIQSEMQTLSQANASLAPKAAYYDLILACPDAVAISVIAKDYGRSAVWLNSWLHEHGVQYKQGDIWLLYADYADKEYTRTRTHSVISKDGSIHARLHTYWTQKGRRFLYELLKKHEILPTVDKEEAELQKAYDRIKELEGN